MKECYLYKKEGDYMQCQTCEHRCRIAPWKCGICGVRENQKGKLYLLVYGRIIAENIDPIEKKPLYHFLPGTKSLSIATVGCNLRCLWCFPSNTKILTDRGVLNIQEVPNNNDLKVISHLGRKRNLKSFYKTFYEGELLTIKAGRIPPFSCTPKHQIYMSSKPQKNLICKKNASELSKGSLLVIPRRHESSHSITLDNKEILSNVLSRYKVRRKISYVDAQNILELSNSQTSRTIAQKFHLHPAYVRTLRSRNKRERWNEGSFAPYRKNELGEAGSRIYFKYEKKPYLKRFLKLDDDLAYLLGYYCAEGWVTKDKNRPNSYSLGFAFSKKEAKNVAIVQEKFQKVFRVRLSLLEHRTVLQLTTAKGSVALIFKILCGAKGTDKKVPPEIFQSKKETVKSFLEGYVAGDGYKDIQNQIVTNTVSESLAYGIFSLWLKLGFPPAFYKWRPPLQNLIEGRMVNQNPLYYIKVWPGNRKKKSKYYEDDEFFYVPVSEITQKRYSGWVYNLEVEEDHSYLANFAGVGNCQNYDIAQCTKDNADRAEIANRKGIEMEPEQIVADALKYNCPSIAYTYTEPTIFLEFALDTMKLARKEGLKNIWVSNGYMTRETLDLITPYLDAINIDLKGFSQVNYLKYSGAKLQPVLDNIQEIYKRKIHLEVTTLIVPGVNDDKKQLESITRFLSRISKNIPWHISRFFPAYKMTDTPITPIETMRLAEKLGKKAGLRYIHLGNI